VSEREVMSPSHGYEGSIPYSILKASPGEGRSAGITLAGAIEERKT
jgi:hypothetical protein